MNIQNMMVLSTPVEILCGYILCILRSSRGLTARGAMRRGGDVGGGSNVVINLTEHHAVTRSRVFVSKLQILCFKQNESTMSDFDRLYSGN